MTNIFHSDNLEKDFSDFEKQIFKTNKFNYSINNSIKPHIKKYHRLTYVLALFSHKLELEFNEDHKFIFLNEIVSDLLINSSIVLIGFHNASQIIFRRIIENFFNHIFYFDHPVEFEQLNLGKNEYQPILELKNYFESYPNLQASFHNDINIKINLDKTFLKYQELCKIVHSKGKRFMGLAKNLQEIKPVFNLSSYLDESNSSLLSIIYLLYKFHPNLLLTNVEKNILSESFSRNIRSALLAE